MCDKKEYSPGWNGGNWYYNRVCIIWWKTAVAIPFLEIAKHSRL